MVHLAKRFLSFWRSWTNEVCHRQGEGTAYTVLLYPHWNRGIFQPYPSQCHLAPLLLYAPGLSTPGDWRGGTTSNPKISSLKEESCPSEKALPKGSFGLFCDGLCGQVLHPSNGISSILFLSSVVFTRRHQRELVNHLFPRHQSSKLHHLLTWKGRKIKTLRFPEYTFPLLTKASTSCRLKLLYKM